MPARVALVGAGPGDPGLLTCRGRELLQRCDCVLHDSLVNPRILALAPPEAVRIDVGKRGGLASPSQEAITAQLVALAAHHRLVVRLKGGDPFLFGRGGEEAAALAAAAIPFEIVPGVTSGTGVPAYAGIPITHRAAASAVAFVTGHRQAGQSEPDWSTFARIETLVLYMGMHRLAQNCAALIAHGRAPETPACTIQWGTYPRQRVVLGTLATLPDLVAQAGLGAPAITVVGEVCRYRERIRWFDDLTQRPLSGRRLLVTSSPEQASHLADLLEAQGAETLRAPLTRILPAEDPRPLDAALLATDLAWIAFTSANAVRAVWDRLQAQGRDARALAPLRLAAVGSATAAALASHGLRADLVPASASGLDLAEALARHHPPAAILLPQASNARGELAQRLRAAGWQVRTVEAYRAVPGAWAPDPALWEGLDGVTLTSGAAVARLLAAFGAEQLRRRVAQGVRVYAIGPQTAHAWTAAGLPPPRLAAAATTEALVAAILTDLGPASAA